MIFVSNIFRWIFHSLNLKTFVTKRHIWLGWFSCQIFSDEFSTHFSLHDLLSGFQFFFFNMILFFFSNKLNIFCHRMSHLTGMIFVSNIFHFSLHDFLSGFQFFFFYMIFFSQDHYFITEFQRFIFKTFSNFLQYAEIQEFFFLFIYLLNYVEFFWCC